MNLELAKKYFNNAKNNVNEDKIKQRLITELETATKAGKTNCLLLLYELTNQEVAYHIIHDVAVKLIKDMGLSYESTDLTITVYGWADDE